MHPPICEVTAGDATVSVTVRSELRRVFAVYFHFLVPAAHVYSGGSTSPSAEPTAGCYLHLISVSTPSAASGVTL